MRIKLSVLMFPSNNKLIKKFNDVHYFIIKKTTDSDLKKINLSDLSDSKNSEIKRFNSTFSTFADKIKV